MVYFLYEKDYSEKELKIASKMYSEAEQILIYDLEYQLSRFRASDILIFDNINVLCNDGYKLYLNLLNRRFDVYFMKSPNFDTQIVSMKIASIQNNNIENFLKLETETYQNYSELDTLLRRCRLMVATDQGKQVGLKKGTKLYQDRTKETKNKIQLLSKKFNGSLSDEEVMMKLKISRGTFYKYVKEIKSEQNKDAI